MSRQERHNAGAPGPGGDTNGWPPSGPPFLHVHEEVRGINRVMLVPACAVLAAGLVLFGWRTADVAILCILSCVGLHYCCERLVRRSAPGRRTGAALTGVLLALTLPPFVPWYVPIVAAGFAILLGEAAFGGAEHAIWQPALVGRLAVAVLIPAAVINPPTWPVLARDRLVLGDLSRSVRVEPESVADVELPAGADALDVEPPAALLAGLTRRAMPAYGSLLGRAGGGAAPGPPGLRQMPRPVDMLWGWRGGGLGETSALVILLAGLYLAHRNYVRWQLPLVMLASAWCVAALAPVFLTRPGGVVQMVWRPLWAEGFGSGLLYCGYQLLGGQMMLAALLVSFGMAHRPLRLRHQMVYGVGCGALAMLGQLYVPIAIPAYAAVLVMNTLTPLIEGSVHLRWPAGKRRRASQERV